MKAVIFFPWGVECVIKRNNGAGLRVGLLAQFLGEHGIDVDCISFSLRRYEYTKGNITFSNRKLFSIISYFLYGFTVKLGACTNWVFPIAIALFLLPRIDPRFTTECKRLIENADILFVEYPFWVLPIRKIAISLNKTLILTNHDQTWRSWTEKGVFKKLSRRILRRLEMNAMQNADVRVVVAEADRKSFEELGISAITVRNAIDIKKKIFSDNAVYDFKKKWEIQDSERACLFVGGGWYPNILAANSICRIIAPKRPEMSFYLVGRCASHVTEVPKNVFLIKNADNEELELFYRACVFSLIPLKFGTGSSLKTIEALNRGRVIISTSVGARDLPFITGIHGFIEDDFEKYPEILLNLLQDKARKEYFKKNAVELAQQFDYHVAYLPYLEAIERLLKNEQRSENE